jgi:LacI family transcriptional regulator
VRPTAVCCSLVYVAAIVESLAMGLGRRVPQDLAVIAADAAPDAGQALVPVTTVGPSVEEMAAAALEQLRIAAERPRSRGAASFDPVILSPRITVRASCGAQQAETVARPD